MSVTDARVREQVRNSSMAAVKDYQQRTRPAWVEATQNLAVLFKARIVSLLLLAATGGAFLGAGGWPGGRPLLLLFITGGMAASGASALNQYLERNSDSLMGRTRQRPLVTGAIRRPAYVLVVGVLLVLAPVLAVWPTNPALAFFLLLGALIYVAVYTIWLKPRSLLNIVIGGAAGSAAVMSGGAAVGAWQNPAVIALALLLFLWTPSHFWTLAILYRDEYQRADVPMLPARTTPTQAAWWVLVHTSASGLASLALASTPGLGLLYLVTVSLITIDWFRRNFQLIVRPTPQNARSLFIGSNVYLTIVLLALCVDMALG